MNKKEIIELLKDYNKEDVEKFASYCVRMQLEKKKDGTVQNPFMQKKTSEDMAVLFKRVARDGLVFDGVNITIQSTGISYNYIAYKNKMYLTYPESIIDVNLVHKGDEFSFEKENGKVIYTHKIGNPFSKENIIGGYCVLKNKRGEFITILSSEDIDKHRKVAKTDYIWKQWFEEMAIKTIIKKACKLHFADVYQNIEEDDNENYNLDYSNIDISLKDRLEQIKTLEELRTFYKQNEGLGKEFTSMVTARKTELQNVSA